MRLSDRVKPISYFKANAAEILADLTESREPMAITQNGEVKAVVEDVHSWEKRQEAIALLKLLTMGDKEIEEGRTRPAREAIAEVRAQNAG
jgi:PHD/YefM family antitoxin component YafN of YafNO toxin-antitoxin module